MQIKDLIRLLENHHKDAEVKCLVKNDGDEYDIEIEGVGTIEDDEVIYVYAKEE